METIKSNAQQANVVAIVLNYKRPQNIEPIVHSLLQTPEVSHVVVSNNNPEEPLPDAVQSLPKVTCIEQPHTCGAALRHKLAQDFPAQYYLFCDDDVFLSPQQFSSLVEHAKNDPAVPHGMFSQQWNGAGFEQCVPNIEGEVDVISRVYCASKACVDRCFQLLLELGFSFRESIGDDIVLSFSGAPGKKPISHNLGAFTDCETAHAEGIATWRRPNFFEQRSQLYTKLQALAKTPA